MNLLQNFVFFKIKREAVHMQFISAEKFGKLRNFYVGGVVRFLKTAKKWK